MRNDDNAEAMREHILSQLDRWSFPSSEWEKKTVGEVSNLPVTFVPRMPMDQLITMGMQPNECHENAWFLQENDLDDETIHVVGWIDGGEGRYALHSVCEVAGRLICVTPVPFVQHAPFRFIRDDEIVVSVGVASFDFTRSGHEIGIGLRMHPERVIAECDTIKRRLLSGEDPYQVMR